MRKFSILILIVVGLFVVSGCQKSIVEHDEIKPVIETVYSTIDKNGDFLNDFSSIYHDDVIIEVVPFQNDYEGEFVYAAHFCELNTSVSIQHRCRVFLFYQGQAIDPNLHNDNDVIYVHQITVTARKIDEQLSIQRVMYVGPIVVTKDFASWVPTHPPIENLEEAKSIVLARQRAFLEKTSDELEELGYEFFEFNEYPPSKIRNLLNQQ